MFSLEAMFYFYLIFTVFLLIRKRDRDRRVPEGPHKNAQKW